MTFSHTTGLQHVLAAFASLQSTCIVTGVGGLHQGVMRPVAAAQKTVTMRNVQNLQSAPTREQYTSNELQCFNSIAGPLIESCCWTMVDHDRQIPVSNSWVVVAPLLVLSNQRSLACRQFYGRQVLLQRSANWITSGFHH